MTSKTEPVEPCAGDIRTVCVVTLGHNIGNWHSTAIRSIFFSKTAARKRHPKLSADRFKSQRVMFDGKNWREIGAIVKPK